MSYSIRPNHRKLRALLSAIEKALLHDDRELFEQIIDLVEGEYVSLDNESDVSIYVRAASERFNSEGGSQYQMYDDETYAAIRHALFAKAYGDFKEALIALHNDLSLVDPTIRRDDEIQSTIFRPEYFESNEQRHAWRTYRSVLEKWQASPKTDYTEEAEDMRLKLRAYMQAYFGPLVPIMIGTYLRTTEKGSEGVSVRLIWKDDYLTVQTTAPFYEKLDDFFINKHPIDGIIDFTENAFPKKIGGFTLMSVDCENLFEFEL